MANSEWHPGPVVSCSDTPEEEFHGQGRYKDRLRVRKLKGANIENVRLRAQVAELQEELRIAEHNCECYQKLCEYEGRRRHNAEAHIKQIKVMLECGLEEAPNG